MYSHLHGHAHGHASSSSALVRVLSVLGAVLFVCGVMEFMALRAPTDSNKYQVLSAAGAAAAAAVSASGAPAAAAAAAAALPPPGRQPWCPSPVHVGPVTPSSLPVTPFPANFWFVKTVKTGSSTLTSVFHSICNRYGITWLKTDLSRLAVGVAKPKADQLKAVFDDVAKVTDADFLAITNHMMYKKDVADVFKPTMLFTTVRHPLSRVHSHFIQDACVGTAKQLGWSHLLPHRQEQETGPNFCDTDPRFLEQVLQGDTLEARWEFARSKLAQNYVYEYIKGNTWTVDDAAAQYDFIFIAERMNEGLVVFMLQYGLTFEDIVYLPLKKRVGKYKTASDMPKELNDYIMDQNDLDMRLWELANTQLDRKKTQLATRCGNETVQSALATFEQLLDEVVAECSEYVDWYNARGFEEPYTYTGIADIAYDSGNGFRCVQHVARRFMLAGPVQAAAAAADDSKAGEGDGEVQESAVYLKRSLLMPSRDGSSS
uniref:Sulfotransferase n=1 Tax=Tetradesmus obliquus TaxID=3088 RepID=A0A383W372_TETOB|eukprot:jgi/Sobl393_1/10270/SZX71106.1